MIELFYNLDDTVSHVWDSSEAKATVAGWLVEFINPRDYRIMTMPRVNERNVMECYQMRIRFLGPQAKQNAMRFKLVYTGVSPLR
jgi:hypothetical protein